MSTHSSNLVHMLQLLGPPHTKIPRTKEPGGLRSMGLQRLGHDCPTVSHPGNVWDLPCSGWFMRTRWFKENQYWSRLWEFFEREPFTHSVQFSSVAQSCPTLCDPMDCSTPGFPVHYIPSLENSYESQIGEQNIPKDSALYLLYIEYTKVRQVWVKPLHLLLGSWEPWRADPTSLTFEDEDQIPSHRVPVRTQWDHRCLVTRRVPALHHTC